VDLLGNSSEIPGNYVKRDKNDLFPYFSVSVLHLSDIFHSAQICFCSSKRMVQLTYKVWIQLLSIYV